MVSEIDEATALLSSGEVGFGQLTAVIILRNEDKNLLNMMTMS